jgi:hypothetical protein
MDFPLHVNDPDIIYTDENTQKKKQITQTQNRRNRNGMDRWNMTIEKHVAGSLTSYTNKRRSRFSYQLYK